MMRTKTIEEDETEDDAALPVPRVRDQRDAQFLQYHMECLRLFIGLSHLHAQHRLVDPKSTTEEDRDDRAEFEIELTNLHALLTNRHLDAIDVLRLARASIEHYVSLWPGAAMALDRWWAPRHDKHAAVWADLQLVVPGVWIGSAATTLKPAHTQLLAQKRIRHIVHCVATPIDSDDDFRHGAQRATASLTPPPPTIESLEKQANTQEQHRITLFQLGPMEFLVRKREKMLPAAITSEAMHTVANSLQQLLRGLRNDQSANLNGYVDALDGVLLCCESGTTTSVVACVALLMAELCVGYDVAMRLITCARPYVAPSAFFEYALREYEKDPCHAIPKILDIE